MEKTIESERTLTPRLVKQIEKIALRYKNEPDQLMRILLDIQKVAFNAFPRDVAVIVSRITGIPEAKLY